MTTHDTVSMTALVADMTAWGPAPTPQRELAALVANLLIVVVALLLIGPGAVATTVGVLFGGYTAIRLLVGVRRWSGQS